MNSLQAKIDLSKSSLQHWLTSEVLTWNWWFKVVVLIVLILGWVKFVNKKRFHEIVTYGLLVSLICMVLDSAGTSFVFWIYPIRLLPLEFSEIHNLVLFPVLYMLIYQRYNNWRQFFIANVILSFLLTFGEFIAVWLHFYQQVTWKHIYSFPIYILIALFSKLVINFIQKITRVNQREN